MYSGMWYYVIWQKPTSVLDEPTISVFCVLWKCR